MKAALFDGTPGLRIVDAEKPRIDAKTALVKVRYAGICGSDLYIVSGKNPRTPPPLIPGHEFVGTVHELPENHGSDLRIGDRVTAFVSIYCGTCRQCRCGRYQLCENLKILGCQTNGAFAEYVAIPIRNLIRLPEDLNDEQAVLVEPTSIAVHAVRRSGAGVGDSAVVIGGGPIGFLVATVAGTAGCNPVVVLEVSGHRLEACIAAGFTALDARQAHLRERVREAAGGRDVDLLFECAAQDSSVELFRYVGGPLSKLIVVGNYKSATNVHLFQLARKEQSILTSWLASLEDYEASVDLLRSRLIRHDIVASHFVSLQEIGKGLELASSADTAMRVVVEVP